MLGPAGGERIKALAAHDSLRAALRAALGTRKGKHEADAALRDAA